MKLQGYKKIGGIINVITGLHIGGSTSIIEIGGKDNPVIKHPVTGEPYIPGSSLKGKMRSLLELKLNLIDTRKRIDTGKNKNYGEVHKYNLSECSKNRCPICFIFGTSADEADIGPTRLIVRDAFIEKAYRDEQMKKSGWTVFDLTEDKWENSINRITAKANPRSVERVLPGAKFSFEMSYRVFERDGDGGTGDEGLFKDVLEGLNLIEKDALGGAGSRGCGQVKFEIKTASGEQLKGLSEVNPSDFPTIP